MHHLFPNRASNSSCASGWFYILFPISYLSMIYSGWSWLHVARGYQRIILVVRIGWLISGTNHVLGVCSVACILTTRFHPS